MASPILIQVVIKNCVDAATQHWLARMAMQRGTKPFPDGFYKTVQPPSPSPHPATSAAAAAIAAPTRVPNSKESCGRGRVYDAAESEQNKQPRPHTFTIAMPRTLTPGLVTAPWPWRFV